MEFEIVKVGYQYNVLFWTIKFKNDSDIGLTIDGYIDLAGRLRVADINEANLEVGAYAEFFVWLLRKQAYITEQIQRWYNK